MYYNKNVTNNDIVREIFGRLTVVYNKYKYLCDIERILSAISILDKLESNQNSRRP